MLLGAILVAAMLAAVHLLISARGDESAGDECNFTGQLVPNVAAGVHESRPGVGAAGTAIEDLVPLSPEDSWRYGFGMALTAEPERWARALGAGWYLDWAAQPRAGDATLDYWMMVRVAPRCTRPSLQEAARLARQYPGRTWIIGNEPDVASQDNQPPGRYAALYHDFYEAIKAADPKAQVAVAGVSQPTPLRLIYLDNVLEAYRGAYERPMPVDVWTVHNFVLREERQSWGAGIPTGLDEVKTGQLYEVSDHARLDLFERQLREFRRWMAERGYRDTPLALTEFGVLMPPDYGFPPAAVSSFLEQTFDLLADLEDPNTGYPSDGNRLVQRWAWFSLSDSTFPTGNLADLTTGRLTELGLAYRRKVEGLTGGR